MGPWNTDQINQARRVPFSTVLNFLGAYYKRDREYESLDPSQKSIRIHVDYQGSDFRFILTGEKWLSELLPADHVGRGGGVAIDFVKRLTGFGFVQAVKVCLNAGQEASGQ